MSSDDDFIKESLKKFQEISSNPDDFLCASESLKDAVLENLKRVYDFSKREELKLPHSDALPELIYKGFDLEQVWQQVELQNEAFIAEALVNVSKCLANDQKLVFVDATKKLGLQSNEHEIIDENELEKSDSSDEIEEFNEMVQGKNSDSLDGDENDKSSDADDDNDIPDPNISEEKNEGLQIEDNFFKLNEMENFLVIEEKKMNEPDSGNESVSDEEDEEDVDLFEADSEDDENVGKDAKYQDFFGSAENTYESKRKRDMSDDSDGEAEQLDSTLEMRDKRLKQIVEEIEENAVGDKPWQLKGEITSECRPQNSLLEEVVEFDLIQRPAPVITEQTSLQLEDIIKQRIKDKVFDSVERKAKMSETPLEFKKKLVLNQEKSKESLAQIYEKEYLDKEQATSNPDGVNKEPVNCPLHTEIKSLMRNLFMKLDVLSNLHFTPKPVIPELKIVNNLPAINIEEVAPIASTDSALLAPEEVKQRLKGDLIGKSERSDTDKKRQQRRRKRRQQKHSKEKSKQQNQGGLSKKQKMSGSNVDSMDQSLKGIKSSTAFFTQLQEEVHSQIRKKSSKRKTVSNVHPKKYKL